MRSRTPLVSIVLPTYNGARFLAEAIESCLAQRYRPWELIVVDDASTDETPEIIARFTAADARIRSIRHASNRRLPGSLNTGFAAATGDYLTWTSDDNLYDPSAIETMVEFLERERSCDFVYADYRVIDEDGRVTGSVRVGDPSTLIEGNRVGACFLYRSCVGRSVGRYATDLFLAEDYEYWLRVACRFRLEPLHQEMYSYREHVQSLTGQRGRQAMVVAEKALARWLVELPGFDGSEKVRRYLRLANAARRRGEWAEASGRIAGAFRCSPTAAVRWSLEKTCSKIALKAAAAIRR